MNNFRSLNEVIYSYHCSRKTSKKAFIKTNFRFDFRVGFFKYFLKKTGIRSE